MTTVREINDPADLEPLRPAWDALLQQTPAATYCQTLDWLQAFWNHYGAGKRMRVLVVEDGGHVIGILPLAVWAAHPHEPFKALTYPLDYWGDSYGPIGPNPAATLEAGFDHVRRTPRDWCYIELAWVDELADAGRTKSALESAGFPALCDRRDMRAVVDLTAFGSWEAYCASHNSKWRNTLGRQEKKLARRGAVSFLRHRRVGCQGAPVRWGLYDACERISQASWQGRAPRGTMLNKDADRGFFRECFERAGEHGGVDLDLLFVDDEPAAFCYSYYYRGLVTEVKTAFHPSFAFEGAGAVVQARFIAECFARGDHTIEMGDEFLSWKRIWVTGLRPVLRYVHFPHSRSAQLIRGKRAIERRLRSLVREWRTRTHFPARDLASPERREQPSPASKQHGRTS
jgi:hypothetical protein